MMEEYRNVLMAEIHNALTGIRRILKTKDELEEDVDILTEEEFFLKVMTTKYVGFKGITRIKSQLQDFIDSSLRFFDTVAFQKRIRVEHIHL